MMTRATSLVTLADKQRIKLIANTKKIDSIASQPREFFREREKNYEEIFLDLKEEKWFINKWKRKKIMLAWLSSRFVQE